MRTRTKKSIQFVLSELWRGCGFAMDGLRWLFYPSTNELITERERLEIQVDNTRLRRKLNREKSALLFGGPSRSKRRHKHKKQNFRSQTVPKMEEMQELRW